MYLPKLWADDSARREKAGIPDDVVFKTKPQIALDQIKRACVMLKACLRHDVGLPRGTVLMDAGYGVDTDLRTEITALGLQYAVGVGPQTTVWAAGQKPLPPKAYSGRGRPPSRPRRDTGNAPVSIEALASAVPKQSWHTIEWREGTSGTLKSRFYRTRVRVAHNRKAIPEDIHEEWLLAEWPEDEKAPTKYWLSTLDETVSFRKLVDITKLRWRIERDYLELKQEVGLGHYEGRGWRGFHHHATLCIATYGFLVAERAAFPPSEPRRGYLGEKPALPRDYRPRGAANPA